MKLDFNKENGLIPTVIQNTYTSKVLMLGYMNEEAYRRTKDTGMVTFFSRSKNRLWVKGETSGNTLTVDQISQDCDSDALLIKVKPAGPTCHLGTESCFKDESSKGFLYTLEQTIEDRVESSDNTSYTKSLIEKGINKVAQKVGEEAVEVVIEAKDNNRDLFLNEVADLTYHLLVLLKAKGVKLEEMERLLELRSNES